VSKFTAFILSEATAMTTTHEVMHTSGVGFGTSGARGLVTQMTDEVCFAYALAFIHAIETNVERHS
jgi:phosphoglucomutase